MRSYLGLAVVLATACGEDLSEDLRPMVERLADLPGVASVEAVPTQTVGYDYYVLQFEQPVDHADPGGPTFRQKVSLLHKDTTSPMVEYTTGYWDYFNDAVVELTGLLDGNQVSIEHRFFEGSRPEPADWSKLTIEQMAADQHAITTALRTIYDGAFITAGASKGGMTAIYYRRFYPDDVDGTVPYVSPISFGAPDARYAAFLETVGPDGCRQAVRDVATEMLANRRAAIETRAMEQATANNFQYTRIALAPAVESSIFNLEWSFWQYYGEPFCDDVPATTATDQEMFDFLNDISPVADNEDARIAQFEAYYYQAYHQLGYPDGGATYLDPYLMFGDADYANALPTAQPAYDDGAAMADIDRWVRSEGNRLLFIYGQWDPWTAGQFELGDATDSLTVTQPRGNHGARITRLEPAERDAALSRLAEWTGVTPTPPMARSGAALRAEVSSPRVPPVLRRALSSRLSAPRGSP